MCHVRSYIHSVVRTLTIPSYYHCGVSQRYGTIKHFSGISVSKWKNSTVLQYVREKSSHIKITHSKKRERVEEAAKVFFLPRHLPVSFHSSPPPPPHTLFPQPCVKPTCEWVKRNFPREWEKRWCGGGKGFFGEGATATKWNERAFASEWGEWETDELEEERKGLKKGKDPSSQFPLDVFSPHPLSSFPASLCANSPTVNNSLPWATANRFFVVQHVPLFFFSFFKRKKR